MNHIVFAQGDLSPPPGLRTTEAVCWEGEQRPLQAVSEYTGD